MTKANVDVGNNDNVMMIITSMIMIMMMSMIHIMVLRGLDGRREHPKCGSL